MSSYLKKALLSAAVIVSFGSYAAWSATTDSQSTPVAANTGNTSTAHPSTSGTVAFNNPTPTPVTAPPTPTPATPPKPAPTPTPVPTPAPTPTPVTQGKYKNGTYTGSVADAIYGNIQVRAIISAGKLTDVKFLQYPNDRRTSVEINQQAMPYLRSEALSAQSAQVDGVSGASDTSAAFVESLGSALTKAS